MSHGNATLEPFRRPAKGARPPQGFKDDAHTGDRRKPQQQYAGKQWERNDHKRRYDDYLQ